MWAQIFIFGQKLHMKYIVNMSPLLKNIFFCSFLFFVGKFPIYSLFFKSSKLSHILDVDHGWVQVFLLSRFIKYPISPSLGHLQLKICSASFHSCKVKCGMRWIFAKFLLTYLMLKLVFHLRIFSYKPTFVV